MTPFEDLKLRRKFVNESKECTKMNWHSYYYWRRAFYNGDYININKEGIRKTWNRKASKENYSDKKMFIMGGSTVWGTGARDNLTIPSLLSKRLNVNENINYKVTNFGESGYVSTQSVLKLIEEIKKGNIPDYVIFYNGVNDIFSTYQQNEIGIPQNEFMRENEFNLSKGFKTYESFKVFLKNIYSISSTCRFLKFFYSVINFKKEKIYERSEIFKLSYEATSNYLQNYKIINSISNEYGFKAIWFWQPTIFSKSKLSKLEKGKLKKFDYLREIFLNANKCLKNKLHENSTYSLHDLSHCLTREDNLFIDWCHLTEEGNSIIADVIYENIKYKL